MCPWCAIGYTQYAKAIQQLAGEIEVETRFMPFELNPDMPPQGKPQAQQLPEVYGRTPHEVEAMRGQMLATAAKAGFPMEYTGDGEPPEPMMWNTLDAHKLLRWALANAGAEAQARLKLALFDAHFRQRRNVSDRGVLLDIAQAVGLDREAAGAALEDEALTMAVRLEEKRARDNRITSVPTFVVNGRYILQGANEPEAFRSALTRIAMMEAQA
jgi:predicted DsbA family dithiol-disulfide isomerase